MAKKNKPEATECEKCNGTGSINFGPICQKCDGSGKFTPAPEPEGEPTETPKPPTLEVVIAAGYAPEVAEGIVARERAKAEAGYPPYGTNPEPPE